MTRTQTADPGTLATPTNRQKLTETVATSAKLGPGQRTIWDVEYKGFGLRIGVRSKTFIVQRRVKGVTKQAKQITVGSYPTLSVAAARDKARRYINQLRDGVDPETRRSAEQAGGVTFGEAWTRYQQYMKAKKRAATTVDRYQRHVDTYLQDWLKRPLAQFDPGWLREQHQKLAADIARGKYAQEYKHPKRYGKRKGAKVTPYNRTGETTANDVFKLLRAVYLRARREFRTLPENPFDNIDSFTLEPRRAAIEPELLPTWYAGIRALPNPVRRDCLLFMLFTGLRKESAVNIKWEHVDFDHRTVFIEVVKGGKKRQFTLPLSDYLVDLLQARKAENVVLAKRQLVPEKSPWVFPCNADNKSKSGHLVDPRTDIAGVPFIPHGLRNTFLTEADAADVSSYAMEVLANHRPPGSSQTGKYLNIDVERLREPMQKITDRLCRVLGGDKEPANVVALPARQAA